MKKYVGCENYFRIDGFVFANKDAKFSRTTTQPISAHFKTIMNILAVNADKRNYLKRTQETTKAFFVLAKTLCYNTYFEQVEQTSLIWL